MRKGDTLGRQMMLPTGCRRRKQLHRKASRHVERSRQSGGLSKTWMPMALQACSTLTLVMPSSTMFTGAVCSCSLPSDGFNAAHPKQKITLVTTWLTSRSNQKKFLVLLAYYDTLSLDFGTVQAKPSVMTLAWDVTSFPISSAEILLLFLKGSCHSILHVDIMEIHEMPMVMA
jgi:hypothetical protein